MCGQWNELELENVVKIEKLVEEFHIWMHKILPYAKMKVKIYERQDDLFVARIDVKLKRKSNGEAESIVGCGSSMEDALAEAVDNFNKIVDSDYPQDGNNFRLTEDDIEYPDPKDF